MLRRALLIALAIAATSTQAAVASPTPPLGHSGRWITDADGRVVILHGVNMVYKRPPYHPSATGFDAADARFLARHGFNNVRVGLIYGAVEPQPGQYADAYLTKISSTQRVLARHRIFSMLDFHQDLYNELFTGEGWPDWAVLTDGAPAEPTTGFPGTYLSSPGMNQAFNNFWANTAGPGGVGLQNRYASAWRKVARRFRGRPYVIGYDLINEPWPGSQWPSCANTQGCPAFEQQVLGPMQQQAIDRIREVDANSLVWYEPVVTSQFGTEYWVDPGDDPRAGMSFHIYCLTGAFSVFTIPGLSGQDCESLEELSIENAEERADENGDTLLLSEFGATDDRTVIRRQVDRADRHMVSWQWWHYCPCNDPTTSGPGNKQAIVKDPAKAPAGDNVIPLKLLPLSRPYPQAVAGEPISYSYDRRYRHFELVFNRGGADGSPLPRWLRTEIFIPPLHYPRGYEVQVIGGQVVSPDDARILRIVRDPGAKQVSVDVRNAGAQFPAP